MLLCAGTTFAGEIAVIPLKGKIDEAKFFFLRRALKTAESQKASAVIIDMDTYGGELEVAVKMDEALSKMTMPTLTYIDTNAGSAGSLIAIATKSIYMAPVSAVGAAAPVGSSGEDLGKTMKEKTMSYFPQYFRGMAISNGHNPDLVEAFMDDRKEVKIGKEIIHAKGTLLTLNAQAATRVIDGKPLFAKGIASSLADVAKQAGLNGEMQTLEPLPFEQLGFWLSELAPIFLLLGIVFAYLEFKMPGTFIPATISVICILIFFTGQYVAGLAGWEVVIVFFVGVALLLSELLIHPGTIIPGLIGVALMLGSLVWAMVDRYPSQPMIPTFDMVANPVLRLGVILLASLIVIAIIWKFLPQSSIFDRLVLQAASAADGPSISSRTVSSPLVIKVGDVGRAVSMLRPSGKAAFGDKMIDVISRGDFVAPETSVRVLAVEGSRIIVEQVNA